MGEQRVNKPSSGKDLQKFTRALLNDIKSFEYMLQHDWFEKGIHRIGAEQELVIVDLQNYRPAPINTEVLAKMEPYPWLDTELARFNLETNFTPRDLKGNCFSELLNESTDQLKIIRKGLAEHNADLVLTGILPTIRKSDLEYKNLTPKKRYQALMEAVAQQLSTDSFVLSLTGID